MMSAEVESHLVNLLRLHQFLAGMHRTAHTSAWREDELAAYQWVLDRLADEFPYEMTGALRRTMKVR